MIYSTGYNLIYLHIWWILTTCWTAFDHVVKTQLHISLCIILKYHKTRIIYLYKKYTSWKIELWPNFWPGKIQTQWLNGLFGPKVRWHAISTYQHAHGTPQTQCRRATTAPPICLRVPPLCHPFAYGTPNLCLGPPLFAPPEARHWRAHSLSLNFIQPLLFAIAILPTLKPIPIGPQKLNYCYFLQVDCWLGLP